jgi:Glycosyl hydrolases family 2, TIM barrel domain/Glycosyl hydrolases family 2
LLDLTASQTQPSAERARPPRQTICVDADQRGCVVRHDGHPHVDDGAALTLVGEVRRATAQQAGHDAFAHGAAVAPGVGTLHLARGPCARRVSLAQQPQDVLRRGRRGQGLDGVRDPHGEHPLVRQCCTQGDIIARQIAGHLSSPAFIAHQQLVAVPTLVGVGQAERATLTATVTVTNTSTQLLVGVLTGDVRNEGSKRSVLATAPAAPVRLLPGATAEITLTATIPEPTLWDFDHPHLYRWVATLRPADGPILHTTDETFGVRTIELRAAGLYLNGEPVRLVGLTRHADSPAHGLADPVKVMAADFADLKRMNAVLSRPAHYPQADFILGYSDRHGLLLIPEIPAWQLSAAQLAHPRIRRLARQQLREMIRSQANHPTVWAWSLGNEFASDTPAGHAFVRELMAMAKALDPTRPVGFVSNRLGDRPWGDAWAVLREAYAPAVLDAVRMSPVSGRTRRATVALRSRGPVEHDLPAYTLHGYRLEWRVAAPDEPSAFAHGVIVLPTLPPGATWSGTSVR